MLKVGITGGIGSGKSLVCKIFEQLGAPVYYADAAAKAIYYRSDIQKKLIASFGESLLDENRTIDRKQLAEIVFKDATLLKKLNAIIHPAVAEDNEEWTSRHLKAPYILKEAAILFESGTFKGLDKIITVSSPKAQRILNLQKREGWGEEEIKQRMDNQLPEDEKIRRSDYVIYNDEQHMLVPQVLELHSRLLSSK